jgi:hypothetical protein
LHIFSLAKTLSEWKKESGKMSTEERKHEIQEIREAHERIAQIVVKGTEYHEPVTVKTIDKKEHAIEVYALSEKDLIEAFQAANADLKDIGNQDKLISNMKLMSEVAARATRQPEIGKILLPLQSAPIAVKALELSGLTGGAKSPKPESPSS